MNVNRGVDRQSKEEDTRSPSGRRATAKEVATEVGVSTATVSNAYNRPERLSSAVREQVFEAAGRLGYAGPDPMGRGLRRGRTGALGVLYMVRLSYAFTDPAAAMFLEGVSGAAEEAGLALTLISGGSHMDRDPEAVRQAAVDGFVVYCVAEDDPLIEEVLRRRLPAVFVDDPAVEGSISVRVDDEGGARAAAAHLFGLGHERLGVVSFELGPRQSGGLADMYRQESTTYLSVRSRLSGYAAAAAAAGLSWEEVPVYECPYNAPDYGHEAAGFLLDRSPRPTALLCTSDQLAFGAIEAARERGLTVPEDLSVVGFDDVPEARRTVPALTTVHQPHAEKGAKAGRALLARLAGEDPPGLQLLSTRLVVRGSTAPPEAGI